MSKTPSAKDLIIADLRVRLSDLQDHISNIDEVIDELRDENFKLKGQVKHYQAEALTAKATVAYQVSEMGRMQTEISGATYSNVQALQGHLAARDRKIIELEQELEERRTHDGS